MQKEKTYEWKRNTHCNTDTWQWWGAGVLTIFETEGREYIALLPLNEDGNSDDGQVYLYRFINNGEDAEPDLENIEDDAEFDRVSEAFNEWMEEQDFGDIDLDDIQ